MNDPYSLQVHITFLSVSTAILAINVLGTKKWPGPEPVPIEDQILPLIDRGSSYTCFTNNQIYKCKYKYKCSIYNETPRYMYVVYLDKIVGMKSMFSSALVSSQRPKTELAAARTEQREFKVVVMPAFAIEMV